MKKLIGFGVAAIGLVCVVGCDLAVGNLCPSGEKSCGGGCINTQDDCCDSSGDYCSYPRTCGPNLTCDNPDPCSSCSANGEQCCVFGGVFEGCSPIGTTCCPLGTYCPANTVCLNGGTSCS